MVVQPRLVGEELEDRIPSLSPVTSKPAIHRAHSSSSFPTTQSGCSIINLLDIQPSTALLSRGLPWLTERVPGRQLAQEDQELGKGSVPRAGPQTHPLLNSRFSWRPWNKPFSKRNIHSKPPPRVPKIPPPPQHLPLPNPRKSPTIPTALPGAKKGRVEAGQALRQQILTSSSQRPAGPPGHKRTEA